MKTKHASECNYRKLEKKYTKRNSLRWWKKRAHREDRANAKSLVNKEISNA